MDQWVKARKPEAIAEDLKQSAGAVVMFDASTARAAVTDVERLRQGAHPPA